MPIISEPGELAGSDVYVDLSSFTGRRLFVTCEGLNFGGSIKLRVAAAMVTAAERDRMLRHDAVLIESSSGNLGVALSIVAASKGIPFVCVTDVRCNQRTIGLMRAHGAEVVVLTEPHPAGGYLQARLDYVRTRCACDSRYVWLDQYGNEANWSAHYELTAAAVDKQFPDLDVLFCGAGTGGTVTGCARYFRDRGRAVRIVAVDAVGSVNFGGEPGPRLIPGLGASVPAPMLRSPLVDDVVHVPEADTVRMCRTLAARGLLFGGSTGTALHGAMSWLAEHDARRELTAVVIGPDLGERYVDTIYQDAWVVRHFGAAALQPVPLTSLFEDTRSRDGSGGPADQPTTCGGGGRPGSR